MSSINGVNNLAAELLLNKIMNGQLDPGTGKTVTSGTRSMSSELRRDAVGPSVASAAVKKSVSTAQEIQTRLTEASDYFQSLDKSLAGSTPASAKRLISDAEAYMTSLSALTVDGSAVFGTGTIVASLGTPGESLTLGNTGLAAAMATATTELGDLKALTGTETDAVIQTAVDKARAGLAPLIDLANAQIGVGAMQIGTLEGRSSVLDTIAGDFAEAANNQFVTNTGSATNLLNNVVG